MKKYVYHGSPTGGLKVLQPKKSTHLENFVYATASPAIALVFSVVNHGDFDFDLAIKNGKIIFTERRKGAFDQYNQSGYLYTLNGTNFKHEENLWEGEVVSRNDEEVLSCEYIPNILKKLEEFVKNEELIIYRYPNKPDFIPKDDSDLVDKYIRYEKNGHKGAIDTLLFYFPQLQEMVFSKLETPSEFYYIDRKNALFDDVVVTDNVFDALLRRDCPVFERENGWVNYDVIDSKIVFEKGGFNLNEDFYIYKLKGNVKRLSAHSFKIDKAQMISCTQIDLTQHLASKTK